MPPTLPDNITVRRDSSGRASLTVDGEPFPFVFGPDVDVRVIRDEVPQVTLTLYGRSVHSLDDFLTDAQVARHVEHVMADPTADDPVCVACDQHWPCLAERERQLSV